MDNILTVSQRVFGRYILLGQTRQAKEVLNMIVTSKSNVNVEEQCSLDYSSKETDGIIPEEGAERYNQGSLTKVGPCVCQKAVVIYDITVSAYYPQ